MTKQKKKKVYIDIQSWKKQSGTSYQYPTDMIQKVIHVLAIILFKNQQ